MHAHNTQQCQLIGTHKSLLNIHEVIQAGLWNVALLPFR